MRSKTRALFGSTAVLVMALAAVVVPRIAEAALPGQICNAVSTGSFIYTTGGGYSVPGGGAIRIEDYADAQGYHGHANGQASGYLFRSTIDQSTCR